MCPNFEIPKTINFPFGTNRKFIILGVSILMHITVMFLCVSVIKNDMSQNRY